MRLNRAHPDSHQKPVTMAFPPERIEAPGQRLRLRKPEVEDVFSIYEEYAQDTEVTRFMLWEPHKSMDETNEFMGRMQDAWSSGQGHRAWVMERVEDGALLGMMGFHHHMPHSIQVGYVLARKYWGSGYTAEALRLLINEAFGTDYIDRICAFCDVENKGSARVMEKAGMSLEGTLRGYMKRSNLDPNLRDCLMYGILRQDWEKSP